MTLAEVLVRLEIVRPCAGGWIGRCPAHQDRNPSLSIREGDGRKVLLKCFAGCDYRTIIYILDGRPWQQALGQPAAFPTLTATPDDSQRIEIARRIWREAKPATGTLVETYLRSRGITMAIPPSLRFRPSMKHPSGSLCLPKTPKAVKSLEFWDRPP